MFLRAKKSAFEKKGVFLEGKISGKGAGVFSPMVTHVCVPLVLECRGRALGLGLHVD